MAQLLKQSTQVIVQIGPFVDVTDGFTPETGVTLSGADEAELLKANTTTTTDISGATWAAITGCDGYYGLTLTTSHTDTCGTLTVMVNDDSVCLPVMARFQVVEEAVFDRFYAASATGNTAEISDIESSLVIIKSDLVVHEAMISDIESSLVIVKSDLVISNSDTTKIESDVALAETNISDIESSLVIAKSDLVLLTAPRDGTAGAYPELGIIDQGTAQSATATTLVLRAATPFSSDDACNGAILLAHGSTQGYWQARTIDDYTTADDTATVSTWDVTPSGTITYKVFGTPPSSGTALSAAQDSKLTKVTSDVVVLDSAISDVESSLVIVKSDLVISNSDTAHIESDVALAEGNISDIESSLVIVKSDLVVHEAMISDVESSLVIVKSDLVISNSDTTAIQTKTDSLTFTVANQVDVNVQSINDATVVGAGTSGNKWRA